MAAAEVIAELTELRRVRLTTRVSGLEAADGGHVVHRASALRSGTIAECS